MTERTVIYADEGRYLTDGEIYGKVIFLSESDDISNYREITDEEYAEIVKASEAEGEI